MRVAFSALVVVSLVATSSARALAADPATAQTLFDEGKRLMASHAYSLACPKFEESQRLDPGMGTLFHLADCDERVGKTASAWAAYLEVAAEATARGEGERATAARARATALEPRLARLTIDPSDAMGAAGLQLTRDGAETGQAQWRTAVPVDPGPHTIEARAAGKIAWSKTVTVADGAKVVVSVPLLGDASPAASPAAGSPVVGTTTTSSAEVDTGRGDGQRIAGAVLGAAGLAGVGVGAYFGVVSLQRHADANPHCSEAGCDAAGVSFRDDARVAGNASTIAFATGGAVLLAGIITYVTAPRSSPPEMAAAPRPTLAIGPGGVAFGGAW